jgi:hypothetical protein
MVSCAKVIPSDMLWLWPETQVEAESAKEWACPDDAGVNLQKIFSRPLDNLQSGFKMDICLANGM